MSRLKLSLIFSRLFDFRGYKLCEVVEENAHIILFLVCFRKSGVCPLCGKRCSNIEDTYKRRIRDLDVGVRKCFIVFCERKIRCSCGYRGLEKLDFVDKYSFYTKRFEDYVSKLCRLMSLNDVAEVAGIDSRQGRH